VRILLHDVEDQFMWAGGDSSGHISVKFFILPSQTQSGKTTFLVGVRTSGTRKYHKRSSFSPG
jgi:hypothetical protein